MYAVDSYSVLVIFRNVHSVMCYMLYIMCYGFVTNLWRTHNFATLLFVSQAFALLFVVSADASSSLLSVRTCLVIFLVLESPFLLFTVMYVDFFLSL